MRKVYLTVALVMFLANFCPGQWEKLSFPRGSPYTLLNATQGLFAANARFIYLSTDSGLTWDSLASISTGSSELIEIGDVLLSASSYARIPEDLRPLPCVFRSDDSGRSWDSVLAGVYGASSIALFGPTLLANPDGRLFSSADTGKTWTWVDGARAFTDYISEIIVDGSTLYLRIQADRLYRSNDGAKTWDSLGTGILPHFYNIIAHDSSVYVGSFESGFFVSHDQGIAWKAMNSGLLDSSGFRNLFLVENTLLASVSRNYSQTVYRLHLSDTTWERFDSGLDIGPLAYIYDFASDGRYIFLATDNSIWRRPFSDLVTGVQGPPASPPTAFLLEQNYPNPFNPSTGIRYQVPVTSEVRLVVYDVLGREVATLVSEIKGPGVYTVKWDATGLASGMYFCRIQAGAFVQSKKLLLSK